MDSSLMPTYARLPIAFTHGSGAILHATDGRAFLDGLSGIAVTGLGHAHPGVTAALAEQAGTLIHTSNLYGIPLQERLGERLCRLAGMERVFFANSGAEANEAAIKLARLFGHGRGIETPTIIVMTHAFHGRTMATLTATGNVKAQQGFSPLLEGFVRVPFDDVEAVEQAIEADGSIVAVLVEPIQGEGGLHIPAPDYLERLRLICDEFDLLLMLDEVQTGNGRTGAFFCYQHTPILPDVVTTAKGLGNGVPIGACLARGRAAALFGPGNHGSTFGGNPLACRAGLAVLDALENDGLIARAGELGDRMLARFRARLAGDNRVVEVRGRGLMIGIELDADCPDLVARALDAGLLINVTGGRVVRLLPPLVLTDAQADELVDRTCALIESRP